MPTTIVKSGTKVTVKTTGSFGQLGNAVRPLQPQKGTKNPPHLQTNLPKSILKRILGIKE